MIINTNYKYQFRTIKKQSTCKCKECGKTIRKTFSDVYREDCMPNYSYIDKQIEQWKSQEHICNKCLKQRISQERSDITECLNDTRLSIDPYIFKINELKIEIDSYVSNLNKNIKGKVGIYNDQEYVINYAYYCLGNKGLHVDATKIDKRQPWSTTERYETFIERQDNDDLSWNTHPISTLKITDEVFMDRRQQVNASKIQ